MDIWNLLLFVPACFALNMAPGPNNLFAMNNARCYGFSAALLGGAGRLAAFSVMIALAASGLAVVLYTSETLFFIVKLLGAAYLFWLAYQLWFSKGDSSPEHSEKLDQIALFRQELLMAAGNPKAILIFTAFLPQFVDPSTNVTAQFFVLGITFLVLETLAISIYALFGTSLSHWFSNPGRALQFNRACASFLSLSGVSLLLSER